MCDQPKRLTERMCDPCSVEGKKEESKHFCVNCLEYFCINCAKDHRKYKQSRDHIVLEELPSDTNIYRDFSTFTRCGFHPEIEIEKFCKLHDAMICRYCLKDTHNACDDVVEIGDCQKGEIEAIPQTLVELKTKYVEHKTVLYMQLEELRNNNSEVKNNIMAYVQNLRDVADRVERSLHETLDSLVSPLNYSLKQAIENLANNMEKVSEFETFHQLMKTYNSQKDKYILVCKLSALMKASVKEQANEPSVPLKKVRLITPINSNELMAELSKCEICFSSGKQIEKCSDEDTSYGSCHDEAIPAYIKTSTSDKMTQLQCTKIELKNDQATQVDKYVFDSKLDQGVQVTQNNLHNFANYDFLQLVFSDNERIFDTKRDYEGGGPTNIIRMDVLSDGRTILIDKCQQVIKLFSPALTLISSMGLEFEPIDMCVVEEKEENIFTVAVCFAGCGFLGIFEYAKDFKRKYNILCNGIALSVTVFNSEILVLSYTLNRGWKVYAIQGINPTNGRIRFAIHFSRQVETNSGIKINMHDLLTIRACSVAKRLILAANDEVYVFDIYEGDSMEIRIQSINRCDWNYKRSGNTNLTSVADVKTDIKGNIYVCDIESGVHQISTKSCRDSRILLSYKNEIYTIAIDLTQWRFIIIHKQTRFGSICPFK